MKKETIRKSNTGMAIFEVTLEFEKKYEKQMFYIHSFASLWHIVLFA